MHKITVVIVICLSCSLLLAHSLKIKEHKIKPRKELVVFVSGNTPTYVLRKISDKQMGIAIEMNEQSAEWIRRHAKLLKRSNVYIFAKNSLQQLTLNHLGELVKFLDFNATVIHITNKQNIPKLELPMKSLYTLEITKRGKENDFVLIKGSITDKAEKLSVMDNRDFNKNNTVNQGLVFKKAGIMLSNIDRKSNYTIPESVDIMILFSSSEKNMLNFIEKK